jgi:hypothetical protein
VCANGHGRHPLSRLCGLLRCPQDANTNAELGEKNAVAHDYAVLAVHQATNLNPFSLCDTDKPEKLNRCGLLLMLHPPPPFVPATHSCVAVGERTGTGAASGVFCPLNPPSALHAKSRCCWLRQTHKHTPPNPPTPPPAPLSRGCFRDTMGFVVPVCTCRYMSQPDFKHDCADFAEVSDAPKALMDYLLAVHRFMIAARPVEDDRKEVHKLRGFMKTRQCTGPPASVACHPPLAWVCVFFWSCVCACVCAVHGCGVCGLEVRLHVSMLCEGAHVP